VVAALIFTVVIWANFFPAQSSPDALHTVAVRMRGGRYLYWAPATYLVFNLLFAGGLGGVALVLLLELALGFIDRRRARRRHPS
jgi:hypothetical protein